MIDLEDLKKRFGEDELLALTDKTGSGVIDFERIDEAISDAREEVATYLNAIGAVKREAGVLVISVQSKALTIKACDICRYYLYDDGCTEIVRERYNNAINWLKLVAKNPAMLGDNEEESQVNSDIFVIPNEKPNQWQE